ncbi:pyrroline-5-carboxylate reductase [Pseudalkalibacillus caeni]|uniref:Pyrroline-5-carboxylate reductase n=1 Tax=Exobacillus caeni TaxID=2574798 RepID=A0A5R9F612_9BACL|nr:pyrroline-5-carboxylate reductase [Pseudalkalibacillus caeni]TLS38987.1 pyrroline-5-carboxylate reductase [Pseudalkalibacillus caeni]
MKKPTILFIGAGRMAEAIFAGLVKNSMDHIQEIIVSNRSDRERLQSMEKKHGVSITTDWKPEVKLADVILLAMPPGVHSQILEEMSPLVKGQFVITVAAGIGPSDLEQRLPEGTPVAWIMPNTAADKGESMSLYAPGKNVEEKHMRILQLILDGIGESEKLTEEQVHDLTAITGSAPAFLYRFVELLENAATEHGISREQAKKLVGQMVYGSAVMLKAGSDAKELREQVTSPGGATAAGLDVFSEYQFEKIVSEAVKATNKKAREGH